MSIRKNERKGDNDEPDAPLLLERELAGRLVSRAPDITRLVDRLEQRGLVARERMAAAVDTMLSRRRSIFWGRIFDDETARESAA